MTSQANARPRHKTVKAADLRDGHLMRLGVSTNYVMIARVEETLTGRIAVTIYNGDTPDARSYTSFAADEEVALSTYNMTDAELEA